MRVIQITNEDAQAIIDELHFKEFKLKEGTTSVYIQAAEDVHRHFHYLVVRWLQKHGATGLHS